MRIAIVNDLALARVVLRRVVESVPGYEVVWEATDGAQAIQKATVQKPDAILMDLVMPGIDGAVATRQIMSKSPCPILVVTSSVGANHGKVYEALGAGGLDAVRTPTLGPGGSVKGAEPLLACLAKLGRMTQREPMLTRLVPPPAGHRVRPARSAIPLLAIGASTGGPDAVARVLAHLGSDAPTAVVVIQHIAGDYTAGFAEWLTRQSGWKARVPTTGDRPQIGWVAIAGGDDHLILDADGGFRFTPDPVAYPYRPSVDVFFSSAAASGYSGVAVLLTGMGSDGARGLADLRTAGWHTIAQNQSSSVVYGMPKAAVESNAAMDVLPLDQIGGTIRRLLAGMSQSRS